MEHQSQRLRDDFAELVERHASAMDKLQESLSNRIDELTRMLQEERNHRRCAEEEARRLSIQRSERIACLAQQRKELVDQISQASQDNRRLRQENSSLSEAAGASRQSLGEIQEQLLKQSNEIERIQGDLDRIQHEAAAQEEQYKAAQDEIGRLNDQLQQTQQHLRESQSQMQTAQSEHDEALQQVLIQRDRIIAKSEQDILYLRTRLQREAAARRKSEGALKRAINNGVLDQVVQDTWLEINEDDKLQREKNKSIAIRTLQLINSREPSSPGSNENQAAES